MAPHPSLKDYVQCYRLVHFDFPKMAEPVLKAYAPKPEICLHFFLRERELIELGRSPRKDYRFPVVLAGQQTSVLNRYLQGNTFISFNIVFQPTALFRLTGIPAYELTDAYLDATLIFSTDILFILEQLQQAPNYHVMTVAADRFIATLVNKTKKEAHPLDTVSRKMIQTGGTLSLDELAGDSYLSSKQFTRKFYERTGVTPKTYQRIIRFARAVNVKNAYPHWDWLRIALECDYFDYQHLVRDYKEFTHQTPNNFHLLESSSPERKLGLTAELYKIRAATSLAFV